MTKAVHQGSRILLELDEDNLVEAEMVEFAHAKGFAKVAIITNGRKEVVKVTDLNSILIIPKLSSRGEDDMVQLTELNVGAILYNLKLRYAQHIIYTYIGSILVSVNPYQELGIYDHARIAQYHNTVGDILHQHPAHLFGIGEEVYRHLIEKRENQVVMISGESGSGKTENFKKLLNYLTIVSGSDVGGVALKILESTPLMESFGNAKTVRNDNSSRFGKYVEIQFVGGQVVGARIRNYLLEKTRVVQTSIGERNYHIFYEILSGLNKAQKAEHGFQDISRYNYLVNNGGDVAVKSKNDAADFAKCLRAWSLTGLSDAQWDSCLRLLSAILHLGNMEFRNDDGECALSEMNTVQRVADELEVDMRSLQACLVTRSMETMNESFKSPLSIEQARAFRHALSKNLYYELFNWLVLEINRRLYVPEEKIDQTVALLDIYGFENFPVNSFEQLCINYANETLQSFFNVYVFKLEQNEYEKEHVPWHYIQFPDNQEIIDLLSKKPQGILHILNDEASLQTGSDESFLTQCERHHSSNSHFEINKRAREQFNIRHFAGNISYTATSFVEKNRDSLRPEVLHLLSHSSNKDIAAMFGRLREQQLHKNESSGGQAGGRRKAKTPAVAAEFEVSLQNLMKSMRECCPWFIRCIKPNHEKREQFFDQKTILNQLRYTGILETVRIRKSGFPTRLTYEEFMNRYFSLQNPRRPTNSQRENCATLLRQYNSRQGIDHELGDTKVFLKERTINYLDYDNRQLRWQAATLIQSRYRTYRQEKVFKRIRVATLIIQSRYRAYLQRKAYLLMKRQRLRRAESRDATFATAVTTDTTKYGMTRLRPHRSSLKQFMAEINDIENINEYAMLLDIPIELAELLQYAADRGYDRPNASKILESEDVAIADSPSSGNTFGNLDNYPLSDYLFQIEATVNLGTKNETLIRSFHARYLSEEENAMALMAFKLLLKLIYSKSSDDFINEYLTRSYLYHLVLEEHRLGDELCLQAISQLIGHPKQHRGYLRLWAHLLNVIGCCRISSEFLPYFCKFVVDNAPDEYRRLIQHSLSIHAKGSSLPQRIYPPCVLEINAALKAGHMNIPVHCWDDVVVLMPVNSYTTAAQLAQAVLTRRGIETEFSYGWSIELWKEPHFIEPGGHGCVLDLISSVELPSTWTEIGGVDPFTIFVISTVETQNGNATEKRQRAYSNETDDDATDWDVHVNAAFEPLFNGAANHNDSHHRGYDPHFRLNPNLVHTFIHGLPGAKDSQSKSTSRSSSTHSTGSAEDLAAEKQDLIRRLSIANEEEFLGELTLQNEMTASYLRAQEIPKVNIQKRREILESHLPLWLAPKPKPLPKTNPPRVRHSITQEKIVPLPRSRVQSMAAPEDDLVTLRMHQLEETRALPDQEFATSPQSRISRDSKLSQKRISLISIPTPLTSPVNESALYSEADEENSNKRLVSLEQVCGSRNPHQSTLLAETRSYQYTTEKWRLLLKKETCHPLESIQVHSAHELHLLLTQVCHNAASKHCMRLTNDDHKHIRVALGDFYNVITQAALHESAGALFQKVKQLPSTVKKNLLRCILDSPLYFSRFYPLLEGSENTHWLLISHNGLRFARSLPRDSPQAKGEVVILDHCPLQEISNVRVSDGFYLTLKWYENQELRIPLRDPHSAKELIANLQSSMNKFESRQKSSIKKERDVFQPVAPKTHVEPIRNGKAAPRKTSSRSSAMVEFGRLFFLNKKSDVVVEEQLQWSSRPLEKYGLLLHESREHAMAVESFLAIMTTMGDYPKEPNTTELHYVHFLLKLGKSHPLLVDEIYCQLLKQTTNNKSGNSYGYVCGWRLMSIFAMLHACSSQLRPYLMEHLQMIASSKSRQEQALAAAVLRSLKKTLQYGGRKRLPRKNELDNLMDGRVTEQVNVHFSYGGISAMSIRHIDTVADLLEDLCVHFGIRNPREMAEFSLCSVLENENSLQLLKADEYIMDVVSMHQQYGQNYHFLFTRTSWLHPLFVHDSQQQRQMTEKYEMLLFAQIRENYLSGTWITTLTGQLVPEQEDEIVTLSVLLLKTKAHPAKVTEKEIVAHLPQTALTLSSKSTSQWVSQVQNVYQQLGNISMRQAQLQFMQILEQWSLFGADIFPVKLITHDHIDPHNLNLHGILLSINRMGVTLLDAQTRQELLNYPLQDVSPRRRVIQGATLHHYKDNISHDEEQSTNTKSILSATSGDGHTERLLVHLAFKSGNEIRLESSESKKILMILNQYIHVHSI